MATAKEFIVAIEIGSSKVTGIAGRKNNDGSISVLAVAKEESSSFIKKGTIYNLDKTATCIENIINRLQQQLKTDIQRVYVGVGGQSIRSVKSTITRHLQPDTKITQDMVFEVMEANRTVVYPDQQIIDVADQEYRVDNQYQIDPVGIQCSLFEGNYLNILQRKTFYDKLNQCFDAAHINVVDLFLSPLALADSVLYESEKRSGCVLVDIGADTTTVLVYSKNILRHIAVIPLGSSLITKDIASMKMMDESIAEELKQSYGSAYTNLEDIDPTLKYYHGTDIEVESSKFIEVVEARMEEIIANVWNQVPQEYNDKLIGGVIITGGGSNMKNIDRAFTEHTPVDKVRIANFVTGVITSKNDEINSHNGRMNTVLGMLAKGKENCAGKEIDPNDMFASEGSAKGGGAERKARDVTEIPPGVIRTQAEADRAAEKEQRRKAEAEDEAARQAEEEREREKEERKKNRPINKLKNLYRNILNSMTEPE